MSVKQRAVPAVAAALIAAGGVVWVAQQRDDRDHTLRGEISTSSTALMIFVVRSKWRGVIAEINTGVSKFHAESVGVLEGEPVTAYVLGRQDSRGSRERISCKLSLDGARVDSRERTIRPGDQRTTVECKFSM